MFATPYQFQPTPRRALFGTTLGDIQIGLPSQAGIPAAPTGFYVPPGFKHLFYADNGSARAESGPLLMRSAAPGVGWLPDVVARGEARVGDSAADWTGTRLHLLRLVQEWGNKGLFTVLVAQQAMGEYGSYPDLDSMVYTTLPAKDIAYARNQPGVFIVGLPQNEPSTAAAWSKYVAGTGATPPPGGTVIPTGKCPSKGVWTGTTCDCKALGPTAQFDPVAFLCVECGPGTVPYKHGSKVCDCLPGYVPVGTEGGGCVPKTGQVTPLPVPTTPPPAIAGTGNPLSDWWAILTPEKRRIAAITGLVSGGVLAWLFLHGTKERSGASGATGYEDDWAYQDTWRDTPRSAGAAPKTWVSPR